MPDTVQWQEMSTQCISKLQLIRAKYIWTDGSLRTGVFWVKLPTQTDRRYPSSWTFLPTWNSAWGGWHNLFAWNTDTMRRKLSSVIFLVVLKFPARSLSHEQVQVCRILPWIYEEKHREKHLSSAMPWTEKQCFTVPPSPNAGPWKETT